MLKQRKVQRIKVEVKVTQNCETTHNDSLMLLLCVHLWICFCVNWTHAKPLCMLPTTVPPAPYHWQHVLWSQCCERSVCEGTLKSRTTRAVHYVAYAYALRSSGVRAATSLLLYERWGKRHVDRRKTIEYDLIISWLCTTLTIWFAHCLSGFKREEEWMKGWERKGVRDKEWVRQPAGVIVFVHITVCTTNVLENRNGEEREKENANAEKGSAWQDLVWKEYVRIQRKVSNNITNWKFLISQLKTLNTKASCWVCSLLLCAEFASTSLETDYASSPNDLYWGFV